MKKSLILPVFCIFFSLLFLQGVIADNESTSIIPSPSSQTIGEILDSSEEIKEAYSCLENQVKNRTLSLQQAIFATLALGSQKNAQDKITSESSNGVCWPKSSCSLKETAQVLLAYEKINKNTDGIQKWILSKNGSSNDLTWYVEVDIINQEEAECSITYDGSARKFKILQNKKVEGSLGQCLTISSSGNLMKISNNCLEKNFDISCNKDFVSSVLYQKGNVAIDCIDQNALSSSSPETCFISSNSHTAASLGTTSEKVQAKCFKNGASCDYEGTLWSAIALKKAGKDINPYLPYLIALAENNQKYFPSSFLYTLNSNQEDYASVIGKQRENKFWEITGSNYGRYYDTSLALLALAGSSSEESLSAKNYLVSVRGRDGCWNSRDAIIDTSFILYSGWPKLSSGSSSGESGSSSLCEAIVGQSCEFGNECTAASGRILPSFSCPGVQVCCSLEVAKQSCDQKGGIVCSLSQSCKDNLVEPSSSGSCCMSACQDNPEPDICSSSGGACRFSCLEGEEAGGDSCTDGEKLCCVPAIEKQGGNGWIWIVLLLILILLIALGIVYRHKIIIWWHTWRGKVSSSPVVRTAGSNYKGPPTNGRFLPGPMQRTQVRPQIRPPVNSRKSTVNDSEFEETLKKLRDMGK